jgi:acyl carrier protein
MNNNKNHLTDNESRIKKLLSEHLGIESEDIASDDSLKEDLHMNVVEISDFLHLLMDKGVDIDLSKIEKINSVQDIIDISSESEEF